ncbi:hypothetical protein [Phytomonospora endophytica]|uniref:Uncharacterized protein n=1 Tax=Phytomonospora endophytica TaxID=714109 RepID=A0A841FMD2_9ACTN|nr:hypothetical protein [Phytomonospora endophytica]MBB6038471.1 hypothetical protein [Phytomonospora endophytica]GIG64400.1 hypothetical protein Pen01_06950 [Phytomonospora endophytica]
MKSTLTPTPTTRRLVTFTVACSLAFTVGTALHNFAVIDTTFIEEMMRRAGETDPAAAAPAFTTGFRIVGTAYVLGNALGMLALWKRNWWLLWTVLAVNVSQSLGWFMIPSGMWSLAREEYGVAGLIPSVVTDGGAAVLALVLIVALVRHRTPWAQIREDH